MPRIADLVDPQIRTGLAAAEQALDAGENTTAVHTAVEVYQQVVERRPDLVLPFEDRRGELPASGEGLTHGRLAGLPMWPDLGVGMSRGEDGQPRFEWRKQRFSMSEATVYLEYVLTIAAHAERTPS